MRKAYSKYFADKNFTKGEEEFIEQVFEKHLKNVRAFLRAFANEKTNRENLKNNMSDEFIKFFGESMEVADIYIKRGEDYDFDDVLEEIYGRDSKQLVYLRYYRELKYFKAYWPEVGTTEHKNIQDEIASIL